MTILFAGNQMDDFIINLPSIVSESNNTSNFDSAVVNNSITIGVDATSTYLQTTPPLSDRSEVWIHYEINRGNFSSNNTLIMSINQSITGGFRLRSISANGITVQAEFWNGSTWIAAGSTFEYQTGRFRVDLYLRISPSESYFEIYSNGSLRQSATVNFAAPLIDSFRLYGVGNGSVNYSQVIVADEPTLNMRYYQNMPTTAGSLQQFSGSVSDINEAILNTNTFVSTSNPNSISTYAAAARNISGFAVRSVIVSINARRGILGPQSAEIVTRIGSTNYFSETYPLQLGFLKYRHQMDINPATGFNWTDTEAASASLEFGVRSIT